MQLEQELAGFTSDRDSLVAIGVFDGVHLGHKYLISQLKELAAQQGYSSVVVTFDKHPQEVLPPGKHLLFLTYAAERLNCCLKKKRMLLLFSLLPLNCPVSAPVSSPIFRPFCS